jgi:DNA-directed RNA polymerase subunit RPC12/RpoP
MKDYKWTCKHCKTDIIFHDKRRDISYDGHRCPICGSRLIVRVQDDMDKTDSTRKRMTATV